MIFVACCYLLFSCKEVRKDKPIVVSDTTDCGPLLVDGKKSVLVEVGNMTASKGLKIFRDSVTYTREDIDAISMRLRQTDSLVILLQDSVVQHLLPFHPLCDEYEHILAILALSPDAANNNAILASIQEDGKLRLNYDGNSTFLRQISIIVDKYEKWSSVDQSFSNDSVKVQIKGYLADSVDQKYTPGLGYFHCKNDDRLIAEKKVYLLYRRDYITNFTVKNR